MRKIHAKLLSLIALAALLTALAACGQPNVAPLTATPIVAHPTPMTTPRNAPATATSLGYAPMRRYF